MTVWERIKMVLGILTLLVVLTLSGGALYAGYILRQADEVLGSVESLTDYHPGGVTRIYATDKDPSTGREYLLAEVYTHYKEYASIKEIPDLVKDATIAIEDERFYDHVGLDLWAIGRALYRNVVENRREGASTITQQLARTLVLRSQQKSMSRKIKEAMVAVKLERNYSKDQILEMYLNEVNYGSGAYGIKGAAKVYFNKPLNKLTLGEVSLLAGLPNSPTNFAPYRHMDRALNRRKLVLMKMVELGKAKQADATKARDQKPKLAPIVKSRKTRYLAPFFCNYVLDQLKGRYEAENGDSGDEDGVKDRGLRIYTTLNWQMQQAAEKAIKSGVAANKGKKVTEAALVSIEPKTGYIRAMVGGADFDKHQYNNAAQGNGRQPGSTFKAVVYSAAFMTGQYGPYSSVSNERVRYPGGYTPRNFDGRYGGSVSITRAVENSMNIPAVRVTNEIGVRKVVDLAVKLGIQRDQFPKDLNLALALGACNATPLQVASIYSVFPNGGNRAHPMSIIRVVDSEGNTLSELANQPMVDKQVIPESVANDMSEIFRKTVTEGTARAATGIGELSNAHAKTGTTSERRDIWFAGYTPELSTVVWACGVKYVKKGKIVRPVYDSLEYDTFGGSTCGPMWVTFMKAAVPIQRQYPGAGRPTPAPTASAKAAKDGDDEERPRYRRRRRTQETPEAPPERQAPEERPVIAMPDLGETKPAENPDEGVSAPKPETGNEGGGEEPKPVEAPPPATEGNGGGDPPRAQPIQEL